MRGAVPPTAGTHWGRLTNTETAHLAFWFAHPIQMNPMKSKMADHATVEDEATTKAVDGVKGQQISDDLSTRVVK